MPQARFSFLTICTFPLPVNRELAIFMQVGKSAQASISPLQLSDLQAHHIHIVSNALDNAGGGKLFGLPHGVLDGVGIGGTVGLDHRLGDAQQRGATYLA